MPTFNFMAATRGREVELSGPEPAIVTARVLLGKRAPEAKHQAKLMGGEYDPEEGTWRFRITTTFELKGGVMRLRRAGVLPLRMWHRGICLATWIDHDWGEPVMRWRWRPESAPPTPQGRPHLM
jgi:hypothetical protein